MSRLTKALDRRLPRWRWPRWLAWGARRASPASASPPTPLTRVPFEDWRRQAGGRVAASAADLLAGPPRAITTWAPRPPETVAGHPGLAEDLFVGRLEGRVGRLGPDISYDPPQLRYARVREAVVLPRLGCVLPRSGIALLETMTRWTEIHAHSGLVMRLPSGHLAVAAGARPTRRLEGTLMSLCQAHATNFGHWLAEPLVAVPDMLDPIAEGALRLLAPPLAPWQRRSLELLGVPASAIEEVEADAVLCADLVCHSGNGQAMASQPPAAARAVFARLAAAAARDASVAAPRFIFVARRHIPSWRKLVNEEELEAALVALGFVVVHPETMSLDRQIATFAAAQIVVGAHGAGLANVGFAPRGCLVFDILYDLGTYAWLWRLTLQLGHRYVRVIAPTEPRMTPPAAIHGVDLVGYFEYRVDTQAVVRTVVVGMERFAAGGAWCPAGGS